MRITLNIIVSLERVAIVALQAVPSTEPDEAESIFHHGKDSPRVEPLLGPE